MTKSHLEQLRRYELTQILQYLPANSRILEIGGGAGWQARELAEQGFQVISIDLPNSSYRHVQEWQVMPYDGEIIPLATGSVDVVYSSNVLEHIPHVKVYQQEILRVLKPEGIVIHLMPSSSWRIWMIGTHYLHAIKVAVTNFYSLVTGKIQFQGLIRMLKDVHWYILRHVRQRRHGENGNLLTEIYLFHRYRWCRLFLESGWQIKTVASGGLFYTGYSMLGERLSIPCRVMLSQWLGSACNVYVLEKHPDK
jgi:2-polyprenyl-3-methyl-5-hydroxy-6-metoxy-1,4-benzoquinol methylase